MNRAKTLVAAAATLILFDGTAIAQPRSQPRVQRPQAADRARLYPGYRPNPTLPPGTITATTPNQYGNFGSPSSPGGGGGSP